MSNIPTKQIAKDATGAVGGKRVLDDHGNWTTVASLPVEVQKEIAKNSKIADDQRRDKALRHNKEYQDVQAQKREEDLKKENEELRSLVTEQGKALAEINAKLSLGATVSEDAPKEESALSEVIDEVIEEIKEDPTVIGDEPKAPAKKLTEKQQLQANADELELEYTEKTTIVELKEMITEHEVSQY